MRARALRVPPECATIATDISIARIPRGPPERRRTPQQVAAGAGPALRLDTVLVTGGTIAYRERRPGRERAGVVTFDTVRGNDTRSAFASRGKPLRLRASARLMGEGSLTVQSSVPLDAPDFRYELSGKLGKMPAGAFNRFLAMNSVVGSAKRAVEEFLAGALVVRSRNPDEDSENLRTARAVRRYDPIES